MIGTRHVTVIGAGTMGTGIAYVCARAGHEVLITDSSPDQRRRGMLTIAAAFAKAVDRGKATEEERLEGLARVRSAATVGDAIVGAHVVIEAIPEKLELKRALFAEIEPLVSADTILASNTSSLPIGEIALGLRSPARVLGLHFFNPVAVMQLVEIVRAETTNDATVDSARFFVSSIGKTPIIVKDSPGFATSRLGIVLGLEAIRMLEQGVASAEDIDRAMELGYNHPMGPLRLGDLVGLDVRLAIADHLLATLGDATYRAPALLREKVARGELGKKTGQGFYKWEKDR